MDGEWSWSGHAAGRGRVVQSPGAWAPRPAGFHGACTAPPPTELQVVRVPGSEGVQEEMVQRSGASCPDPAVCLWCAGQRLRAGSLWRGGVLTGHVCPFLWCKCFMTDFQLLR